MLQESKTTITAKTVGVNHTTPKKKKKKSKKDQTKPMSNPRHKDTKRTKSRTLLKSKVQ